MTELRLLLWALQLQKEGKLDLANLPQPPGGGLTSTIFDRTTPRGFYGICGYRICGARVVRIDMLERLADLVRERVFWRPRFPEQPRPAGSAEGGGFTIVADMMSLVGCSGEEFQGILRSLGFRLHTKKIRRSAATSATEVPAAGETETPPAPIPEIIADSVPKVTISAPEQEAAAPEVAMEEIETWWPKDTGPFRHRPKKEPQRRPAASQPPADAKPDPAADAKPEGVSPQRTERPQRKERNAPRVE
ncbi:MAG: hypothetical protein ACRD3I_14495, partial [Terriglobales bacterium]